MTLDERAAHIATLIVRGNAIPFAVAGTAEQQTRVVADATETVTRELREFQKELEKNPSEKF